MIPKIEKKITEKMKTLLPFYGWNHMQRPNYYQLKFNLSAKVSIIKNPEKSSVTEMILMNFSNKILISVPKYKSKQIWITMSRSMISSKKQDRTKLLQPFEKLYQD